MGGGRLDCQEREQQARGLELGTTSFSHAQLYHEGIPSANQVFAVSFVIVHVHLIKKILSYDLVKISSIFLILFESQWRSARVKMKSAATHPSDLRAVERQSNTF